MKPSPFMRVVLILVALLVLAACGGDGDSDKPKETQSEKPVIRLAVMSWTSAEANIAVAKILLEEELGYPVELVPVPAAGPDQWEALASGAVHAQLETWSSEGEIQAFIGDLKNIEFGGDLGPVGHGGFYVPFYMLDDHPELRTWEALKDPAVVALFATGETSPKGRLLSGDPTWVHSTYAEALIKNLELDFQIEYTGTEEAELAAIDTIYKNHEPLLLYFWTPHWMHGIYDLFEVQLPPYSAECYADVSKINCAYASDPLRKAFWAGLKDYAPEAYQFLKNFHYTPDDQIQIMAQMEVEGETAEAAARAWLDKNEATWKAWLPK